MAKYSFQDIRPTRRRSKKMAAIKRGTPLSSASSAHEDVVSSVKRKKVPVKNMQNKWSSIKAPRKYTEEEHIYGSRIAVWGIALVAVAVCVLTLGGLFYSALITITPRQEKSFIDGLFTSSVTKSVEEGVAHDIPHEVMILSDEESTEVPVTGEHEVHRKASGMIVVFNKHSSASQRLIKNTRFETPDGKIYRIKESIIVPGTRVEGGEIIPGSIEVKVYADEPGEEYNIGLSDFKIAKFCEDKDPRCETFYARSKTDMSGGFSGMLKYASEEDIEKARSELQHTLLERISAQAYAQKPDSFVLYENALFVSFEDSVVEETTGEHVSLTERANLHAVIFDEHALARFIAENTLASFSGEDVTVQDIAALEFTIPDKKVGDMSGELISFTLKGDVHIVWDIDETALKQALAGTSKKDFPSVLAEFPHIKKANAAIRPFWKTVFPENKEKIRIEQVLE